MCVCTENIYVNNVAEADVCYIYVGTVGMSCIIYQCNFHSWIQIGTLFL